MADAKAELNVWARETLGVARDFKIVDAASEKDAKSLLKEINGKLDKVEDSRVQGHLAAAAGFLGAAISKFEASEKDKKVLAEASEKHHKEISDRHAAILKREAGADKN